MPPNETSGTTAPAPLPSAMALVSVSMGKAWGKPISRRFLLGARVLPRSERVLLPGWSTSVATVSSRSADARRRRTPATADLAVVETVSTAETALRRACVSELGLAGPASNSRDGASVGAGRSPISGVPLFGFLYSNAAAADASPAATTLRTIVEPSTVLSLELPERFVEEEALLWLVFFAGCCVALTRWERLEFAGPFGEAPVEAVRLAVPISFSTVFRPRPRALPTSPSIVDLRRDPPRLVLPLVVPDFLATRASVLEASETYVRLFSSLQA